MNVNELAVKLDELKRQGQGDFDIYAYDNHFEDNLSVVNVEVDPEVKAVIFNTMSEG